MNEHRRGMGGFAWGIVWASTAVTIAAILGALQSVAWNGGDAPGMTRALAAVLDPGLLVEAASSALKEPSESYFGYGRLALISYLILFVVGFKIRDLLPRASRGVLAGLLGLAVIGDILAYWVSETAGPDLRRIGFWYTELPSLVAIVIVVTCVGGWHLRNRKTAGVLAAALPLSIATTALLAYLPHGIHLGLALTGLLAIVVVPEQQRDVDRVPKRTNVLVRTAAALAAIAVMLILALAYRPILQLGTEPTLRPLKPSAGLEGARLHVFNTGYNRVSWLLVGRERPWRPVPAFVLEHPTNGLVVFDTGFSDAVARLGTAGLHLPERWVIESRSGISLTLPAQMWSAGLNPGAVRLVVLSHLHSDHTGQLKAFPNARVIAGPGSATYAQEHGFDKRWSEATFETAFSTGPFEDAQDVAGNPGLVLLRGGGHAKEGLMLLLALDEGPLLLAGDAVVHSEWLRSNDVQRIAVDAQRAAQVRNRVRAFVDAIPGTAILYGHDLRGIDCSRSDIVCHGADRFYPEGKDAPDPVLSTVARTH